ncbi:MAG: hypothetical protein KDD55_04370 [Bdellovibrionales bacterium]|nr:hypothetical protein [Bdellovibrionales bacterium]
MPVSTTRRLKTILLTLFGLLLSFTIHGILWVYFSMEALSIAPSPDLYANSTGFQAIVFLIKWGPLWSVFGLLVISLQLIFLPGE